MRAYDQDQQISSCDCHVHVSVEGSLRHTGCTVGALEGTDAPQVPAPAGMPWQCFNSTLQLTKPSIADSVQPIHGAADGLRFISARSCHSGYTHNNHRPGTIPVPLALVIDQWDTPELGHKGCVIQLASQLSLPQFTAWLIDARWHAHFMQHMLV